MRPAALLLLLQPLLWAAAGEGGVGPAAAADGVLAADADAGAAPVARGTECDDKAFRRATVKLVEEAPFVGLFADPRGARVFEASGVVFGKGDGKKPLLNVVFDNLFAVAEIAFPFQPLHSENVLIGDVNTPNSQFEGIAHAPGAAADTFLLLQESWAARYAPGEVPFKPAVVEVRLRLNSTPPAYDVRQTCEFAKEFSHANKGLESIQLLPGDVLLGLCEGNGCAGGAAGRERGRGRVVAARREAAGGGCVWRPFKTIDVPASAFFQDYSALALEPGGTGRVAIASQEDAAVWVGRFDAEALEFDAGSGAVLHLPRDGDCRVIYCNRRPHAARVAPPAPAPPCQCLLPPWAPC